MVIDQSESSSPSCPKCMGQMFTFDTMEWCRKCGHNVNLLPYAGMSSPGNYRPTPAKMPTAARNPLRYS